MIQAVMYFALGVLSAAIAGLILAPPLWRRALRLARRHMERTLPMTRAEIDAGKDQIRAAFALSTRRLEATIEQLETKVAEQLVDINRKREIISHLTAEGSLSAEDIIALEQREKELQQRLEDRGAALAAGQSTLTALEVQRDEALTALAEARAAAEALRAENEEQRVELVARNTELDNLRDDVAAAKTTSTAGEVERASLESELAQQHASLAESRRQAEAAEARLAEAERLREALAATLKGRDEELMAARARVNELELRLVEAGAPHFAGPSAGDGEAGLVIAGLRAEKAAAEKTLASLQAENDALRTAGSEMEDAALRDKLSEIASAVLRLAPMAPPSATVTELPVKAEEPTAAETLAGSLSERIRALQQAGGGRG